MLATSRVREIVGRPEQPTLDENCRHLLSTKGKQVRATLLLEAARLGAGVDEEKAELAATVVEVVHLATLAHDDVIDDCQVRRGSPTVGARAGNVAAGITGAWLFARALELIAECGDRATERFAEAAKHIVDGEILEIKDLHNVDRTRERYLRSIDGKTAELFALSAHLGALLGGCSEEVVSAMEAYGRALGMAFQINDDLLDLLSVSAVMKKPTGKDLLQGVYTLPVIYAIAESDELRGQLLAGVTEANIRSVTQLVKSTSGVAMAEAECGEHFRAAEEALATVDEARVFHDLLHRSVPAMRQEAR